MQFRSIDETRKIEHIRKMISIVEDYASLLSKGSLEWQMAQSEARELKRRLSRLSDD